MELATTDVVDQAGEAADAKGYWAQPGTQPLFYDQISHYAVALAELIRLTGCRSVFEFGCAAGRNLAAIKTYLSECDVKDIVLTGVDINPESVETGRQQYGLEIELGDENYLHTRPDDSVDLVFTVSVLDHIPHACAAVVELVRIARYYLVFLEPDPGTDDGREGKIQYIRTDWAVENGGVPTPFTYLHRYRRMFEGLDANLIMELPLPTHLNRAGPLYRLFLLRKKQAALPWHLDAAELRDRMTSLATLRLLRIAGDLRTDNRKLKSELAKAQEALSISSASQAAMSAEMATLRRAATEARQAAERAIRNQLPHRVGEVVVSHLKRPHLWPIIPWRIYKTYRKVHKPKKVKPPKLDLKDVEQLIVARQPRSFQPIEGKICYILHNSLPYSSGGYATRGHGLATALSKIGMTVVGLTRPGFPLDIDMGRRDVEITPSDTIDRIEYVRCMEFTRSSKTAWEYIVAAADVYEQRLRDLKPEFVIAASFATWTGLPALIATRRLGIPFVYEVRGLAEITMMSRDPNYRKSPQYDTVSRLEALVCRSADRVITLTTAMKSELASRGVDPESVILVPNSCDVDRFKPNEREDELANELAIPTGTPVIGYVGTFVDYEGLEDLATACAMLKEQGARFRLMLVGSENVSGDNRGAIATKVAEIAARSGWSDWLIMPGRVPHDVVERYYSLIDIAAFPRKSWPVTEMVSPMKPLEAMAMEKAVVVSSVAALAEMVSDGETGRIFEKGNPASLTAVLSQLVADPERRRTLGRNARIWVEEQRTWTKAAAIAADVLKAISDHAETPRLRPLSTAVSGSLHPYAAKDGTSFVKSDQGKIAVDFARAKLDSRFANRANFVPLVDWQLSPTAQRVRLRYKEVFGNVVDTRIPASNWKRMDFALTRIGSAASVLDIGPGLGEFVNGMALSGKFQSINCIDVRDYSLYTDLDGVIHRRMISLFDLPEDESYEVVTCFEVLEHLEPELVGEAVQKIKNLATRVLAVSMPLKEKPPSKFHRTTFDEELITTLFPDGEIYVLSKEKYKSVRWVYIEITRDEYGSR